jgi:hypothetical protein
VLTIRALTILITLLLLFQPCFAGSGDSDSGPAQTPGVDKPAAGTLEAGADDSPPSVDSGTLPPSSPASGSETGAYVPPVLPPSIDSTTTNPLSTGGSGTASGNAGGVGASGGTVGDVSAGSSFKTSVQMVFSCAGKPGEITVSVYVENIGDARVEVFYLNGGERELVLSEEIVGTTSFGFTPEKVGGYEVRVHVGVEQSSAYFSVPMCSPGTEDVERAVSIRLKGERELALSKTVYYEGGFVKRFEVYKNVANGRETYTTDVRVTFVSDRDYSNASLFDSVPKSVVSNSALIEFAKKPSRFTHQGQVGFEWDLEKVREGDELGYTYTLPRSLSEGMIESFEAPKLICQSQPKGQEGSLLAASIAIAGFDLPVAYLAAAAALAVIGMAALLLMKGEG